MRVTMHKNYEKSLKTKVASNASWYQLAIFDSDLQKLNSKCLLGKSQTLSDLHRSGASCAFLRNASGTCQCTLYLKNQDAFGTSVNSTILLFVIEWTRCVLDTRNGKDDAVMEQLYLMPGEERYTKFRDEDGVPKIRYTYCSLHGKLFNCTCRTKDEAQRLCEDWLVTQDRCYIN